MKDFQRARQPEQKEERREILLKTARAHLYESKNAQALTLNELARRSNMAKSNVYRYFESREAVLLALLEMEWSEWFTKLAHTWQEAPAATVELESLVADLAASLDEAPMLCHLTSILASVLEFNLSEDSILQFKRTTLDFFEAVSQLLNRRCPTLGPDSYMRLLHDAIPVIAGLYPFCHPSPTVTKVLSNPDLTAFRHHFKSDLHRTLLAMARSQPTESPTTNSSTS